LYDDDGTDEQRFRGRKRRRAPRGRGRLASMRDASADDDPLASLRERGLVSEESNQHQYRFEDIVDLDTGEVLFTLDHEIRSVTHPLFARPLVNRNPDQSNAMFAPGHETVSWALAEPEPAPVPVRVPVKS